MNVYNWNASGVFTLENCFVAYGNIISNINFTNSILLPLSFSDRLLPASCSASHCVGVHVYDGDETDYFDNLTNSSNSVAKITEVFKTFFVDNTHEGYPSRVVDWVYPGDSETFELTDAAKTTYLGDDGTQVGIYGGLRPFTTTLSYPQATQINVAKKAVDGKLNVDIEFNGAE